MFEPIDQVSGLLNFRLVSACQFVGYVCLTLHCRNATPLLVTFDLFAENFRFLPAAAALCRRRSASCSLLVCHQIGANYDRELARLRGEHAVLREEALAARFV
jgi:hypothetical protein